MADKYEPSAWSTSYGTIIISQSGGYFDVL